MSAQEWVFGWLIIVVFLIALILIKNARKSKYQAPPSNVMERSVVVRAEAIETKEEEKEEKEWKEEVACKYRYKIKSRIMTQKEEDSYRRLVRVFEKKFYVIPQVHLGTLFDYKIKGQNWYGAFQHINRKSVDFVLLNKETLKPVCAVELDDYTHEWRHRQERDMEVERIFREAGFPLVRTNNITNMSNMEIVERFAEVINSQ